MINYCIKKKRFLAKFNDNLVICNKLFNWQSGQNKVKFDWIWEFFQSLNVYKMKCTIAIYKKTHNILVFEFKIKLPLNIKKV